MNRCLKLMVEIISHSSTGQPGTSAQPEEQISPSTIAETESAQAPAAAGPPAPGAPLTVPGQVPVIAQDDGRVLGVTIHRTDKLLSDLAVSHPLVRVTIVDADTGKYFPKQHM